MYIEHSVQVEMDKLPPPFNSVNESEQHDFQLENRFQRITYNMRSCFNDIREKKKKPNVQIYFSWAHIDMKKYLKCKEGNDELRI